MDKWTLKQTVDLQKSAELFSGNNPLMLPGDEQGHSWKITVLNGGAAADLSGASAMGYFARTDGNVVPVEGSIEGNVVSVTLKAACYAQPGPMRGIVRLTLDNGAFTLCEGLFRIGNDIGESYVGAETVFPSLRALYEIVKMLEMQHYNDNTAVNAAIEAVDNKADANAASIAQLVAGGTVPEDAELTDIRVGYDGTVHDSAGEAVRAQVSAAMQASADNHAAALAEIARIDADLYENNASNVLNPKDAQNKTMNGVTFAWNGSACTVTGTCTSTAYCNIVNTPASMPAGMIPGNKYYVKFSGQNVRLNIYYWAAGATEQTIIASTYEDAEITIPETAVGMTIRLLISGGLTANEIVTPKMISAMTNEELKKHIDESVAALSAALNGHILPAWPYYTEGDDGNNHIDLDEIKSPGFYVIDKSLVIDTALPDDISYTPTALIVERFQPNVATGFIRQMIGSSLQVVDTWYYRIANGSGVWSDWMEAGGRSVTKNISVYENTYNITSSPQITTDTNGWLQAVDTDTADESGKTDMSGAILSMLNETGCCRLGEGIFYVSGGIEMPAHSTIEGCGDKTQIRLLASAEDAYVLRPTQFCTISKLGLSGGYSALSGFTEQAGTRHGIYFAANADGAEGDSDADVMYCNVSNVFIRNFSGGGVTLHNTGYNYRQCLYMSDSYISNCHTGINIDYFSEFNKFVNVLMTWCYNACLNNGGNNAFTNCTFHATNAGFVIDNSDGLATNNSHGLCIGGTFCHIGSNAGSAIAIKGAEHGYVFEGCQVHYNSIDIENSYGIVFNGIEFGRGTSGAGGVINVSGGGLVAFNGCVFQNDEEYPPEINITNNEKVHFNNCYGSHSGALITG